MQSQKHTLGVRYMLISSSNFLLFPARILPLCEISRDRFTSLPRSASLSNREASASPGQEERNKLQNRVSNLGPVPMARGQPELQDWGTDEGEIKVEWREVSHRLSDAHPNPGAGGGGVGGWGGGGGGERLGTASFLRECRGKPEECWPGSPVHCSVPSQVISLSEPQFQHL